MYHCDILFLKMLRTLWLAVLLQFALGLLADAGCNAIVAAGMGMRPLMGFNQAGITVYYDAEHPIVGDAVRAVAAGEAPIMSADQACNHHH